MTSAVRSLLLIAQLTDTFGHFSPFSVTTSSSSSTTSTTTAAAENNEHLRPKNPGAVEIEEPQPVAGNGDGLRQPLAPVQSSKKRKRDRPSVDCDEVDDAVSERGQYFKYNETATTTTYCSSLLCSAVDGE